MSACLPRRRRAGTAIAVALAAVLGLGTAVHLSVRTEGSPRQTASAFLTAWQRGDLPAMKAQVLEPPRDFDRVYDAFTRGSQARKITVRDIRVRPEADRDFGQAATYHATFSVTLDGPVPYSYDGSLEIIDFDRAWRIHWDPTAIHPDLQGIGSGEVRQIRVVPQADGSSRLVLLETRAKGEQAGSLFADEGLKLVAILADSAQPGATG
ncbi:NTF2-like N-terminal transpeptidase domain-containing protein [Nonomuraea sp. NPDC047897]|uniref:NTF2-like N-terminal transpeptidase domain-containing protein n=1 Tax=Nonomuraea sp. NPDC047897 TaxID=3364346 RepID=UPI003715F962